MVSDYVIHTHCTLYHSSVLHTRGLSCVGLGNAVIVIVAFAICQRALNYAHLPQLTLSHTLGHIDPKTPIRIYTSDTSDMFSIGASFGYPFCLTVDGVLPPRSDDSRWWTIGLLILPRMPPFAISFYFYLLLCFAFQAF